MDNTSGTNQFQNNYVPSVWSAFNHRIADSFINRLLLMKFGHTSVSFNPKKPKLSHAYVTLLTILEESIVEIRKHCIISGVFVINMVSVDIESLLLQAELIKKKDLDHAITLSKKKNFPLAEVLVSAGYIREQTLDVALAAQTFVRNKILTIEIAVRALKEGAQRNLSLDQVLLEYGLNSKLLICTNMLGQLMVDSEFITERQQFDALQIALTSNLPFCRVLVVQRVINNIQAYAVLSAAMLIRRGEVLREHAITALKLTKLTNCPLEVALKEGGFLDSQIFRKVMLGELLMISNQLSEGLFLASLEQNFIEGLPLGKVLVDSGYISQDRLDRALYAQKQISDGQISQMFHADFVKEYAVSFSSIS